MLLLSKTARGRKRAIRRTKWPGAESVQGGSGIKCKCTGEDVQPTDRRQTKTRSVNGALCPTSRNRRQASPTSRKSRKGKAVDDPWSEWKRIAVDDLFCE